MVMVNMVHMIELSDDTHEDFMKILNLYEGEWKPDDLIKEMLWWWNYK